MTKLEKLRIDLAKADTTLANAKKRRALLAEKIRKEEQRELQSMMDSAGLTFAEVRALLKPAPAPTTHNNHSGGERA